MKSLFFLLSSLAISYFCLNILSSIQGYVITSGDQNWFLPIAWAFSETGILFHPLRSPIQDNPEYLLIWHGWLMPWLQGHLNPLREYSHVRLSGDIIALLTFCAYAHYLHRQFGSKYAAICTPALAAVLAYQVGRPELIVSAILIVHFYLERKFDPLPLLASTLALLAITSPAAGLLVSVMLLLRLCASMNDRREFFALLFKLTVVVPLLVYCLTSILSGINPFDWLRGIIDHGQIVSDRFGSGFVQYFVLHSKIPFNFMLLIPLVVIMTLFIRHSDPAIASILALIIVFLIWYLSFRLPLAVYNFLSLAPIILVSFGERLSDINKIIVRQALFSIVLLSLACSMAMGRNGLIDVINFKGGNRVSDWLSAVQALPVNSVIRHNFDGDPFIFSSGIEPSTFLAAVQQGLIPRMDGELHVDMLTEKNSLLPRGDLNDEHSFFLDVQSNSGRLAPLRDSEECILVSNFHPLAPEFFAIPLGRTLKDWSFAIILEEPCIVP
ncbi:MULTISPECIES: hypothetical protein [unclassified Roseobacter]|uniref:hypothetical protein n=1 Tax=unclassified Roseobacter TaxID=196798 RepID=UPI0030ED238B